jgi:hypothetical protein
MKWVIMGTTEEMTLAVEMRLEVILAGFRFVLCARDGLDIFSSPELTEALTARRVLMVAKEHGVARVALVSDCLSMIERLTS